jgi:hypothetical protein
VLRASTLSSMAHRLAQRAPTVRQGSISRQEAAIGDEVDVEVEIEKPNGPVFVETHLPEPSAVGGGHSAHGPEIGPQARRVLELLQELKQSA